MKQNGSNCSKKENGVSQPILDGLSPFHPQWPSSILAIHLRSCYSKINSILETRWAMEVKRTYPKDMRQRDQGRD